MNSVNQTMTLIDDLRRRTAYLSTKEVLQIIPVERKALCRYVRAGKLPALRVGGGYLFDPRQLADYLAARQA